MMNFDEAIKFLSLESDADREVIVNALEEKLFAVKKEILTLIPVPSLVSKRMNQLDKWIEIEELYLSPASRPDGILLTNELETTTDAISFLEVYEKEMSAEKLDIANAATFLFLNDRLTTTIYLQECYMDGFKKFFSNYNEALPEEAKSRDMIDTGKLLNALKNDNITSEITWEIEKELARIGKLPKVN